MKPGGKNKVITLSSLKLRPDTVNQDSVNFLKKLQTINKRTSVGDSANMVIVETKPFVSPQQVIKGMIPGVIVNENTYEPGREQSLLVRGLKSPLIYKSDLHNQQPLYILDGIPLIGDHRLCTTSKNTIISILVQQRINSLLRIWTISSLSKSSKIQQF